MLENKMKKKYLFIPDKIKQIIITHHHIISIEHI